MGFSGSGAGKGALAGGAAGSVFGPWGAGIGAGVGGLVGGFGLLGANNAGPTTVDQLRRQLMERERQREAYAMMFANREGPTIMGPEWGAAPGPQYQQTAGQKMLAMGQSYGAPQDMFMPGKLNPQKLSSSLKAGSNLKAKKEKK